MIPFNDSFLLIYVLNVVMLAGNHALPMMLRFYIWLGTKLWRRGQVNETLHFLLDHPRRYVLSPSFGLALPTCSPRLHQLIELMVRCFLYLFPSHQTWFLVFLLVVFM